MNMNILSFVLLVIVLFDTSLQQCSLENPKVRLVSTFVFGEVVKHRTLTKQRTPCTQVVATKLSILATTTYVRGGGGGYYEVNPNYIPPNGSNSAMKHPLPHGDVLGDDHGDIRTKQPGLFQRNNNNRKHYLTQSSDTHTTLFKIFKSIQFQTVESISNLQRTSPVLSITSWTCLFIYGMWQLCYVLSDSMILLNFMRNYFVCSKHNMRAIYKWPSIVLSAFSHTGLYHILYNVAIFLRIGPTLQEVFRTMNKNKTAADGMLWELIFGSAIAGNIMYLILDRNNSSGCLGLSAVTFSFLAMFAKLFPHQQLKIFIFGIVPVSLSAQQLLLGAFIGTMIGIAHGWMATTKLSNVAHSAHLGGLLFGLFYHTFRVNTLQQQQQRIKFGRPL